MAHHEDERTTTHGVLDMLVENGLEGMADAMATMLNEARLLEFTIRSNSLEALLSTQGWQRELVPGE